jgi:diadenosine tetraphosphatase ApaH/serine/threonine PP2A family protein phosphatase
MIPTSDIKTLMEASRSFGWTLGSINAAGGYDWLSALPLEQRMPLPSGDRVLIVHAAPGLDDGPGLYPELTDQELLEAGVAHTQADLIFVGHTHVPMDRIVGGTRVINLGSISNPPTPERRAMWTLLTADTTGYTLEPRFCSYDTEEVCSELDSERHPSTEWLKSMLRTRGLDRPG